MKMQKILLNIGKTGCYMLSIVYLAYLILKEKNYASTSAEESIQTFQLFRFYQDGINKGWFDEELYMKRPDLAMEALLSNGAKVSVRHEKADYKCKANEYEISRVKVGSIYHFVVTKDSKIIYDPFGYADLNSLASTESKRIFTVKF